MLSKLQTDLFSMQIKIKVILISVHLLFISNAAHSEIIKIPEVNLRYEDIKSRQVYETAQTSTINRTTIKNSPVLDLTQLLKQEQSIIRLANNSGDYSQVAFSIQGFGDNAVANSLILVDGFPLVNPSLLAPNFNSIALSDIERMDITQGSEGVLWGDQAVGGVVNIITRHPEKKIFDANVGFGSFNKQYYNIFAGNRFSNGVFIKAFGYTNKTNNYRDHNAQTDENLAVQAGKDYSSGMFSVNAQGYEDTIQFPGGLTKEQYDQNPRQATNFKNYIHFRTPLFQFLNKQSLNDNWLLETRLERHETIGNGFMFTNFDRNDVLTSYRFRFLGNINQSKVAAGYEGQHTAYHFLSTRVEEQAKTQQNNLFAKVTVPLIKHVEMIAGTRAAWQKNHDEPAKDQLFYSLNKTMVSEIGVAVSYDQWKYFLRRAGSFRFPKANEETWVPAGVDVLKLQTGISYEMGGERKTEKQRSQINIYQLELLNEIAFNPTQTPTEPFGSYNNFPKTLRRGVTLTEYYRLTEKIGIDGQFNVVDARFTEGIFSGNQIPAVPWVNANMGLSYDFIPDWRIKYIALYNGSAYASKNDENKGSKIPGYWINTLSLQYIKKSYNINFEVINVFNQKYSVYTLYDPENQTNTYYPGAGRSYLITCKIDLA